MRPIVITLIVVLALTVSSAKAQPQVPYEPDGFTVVLLHCDEGEGDVVSDATDNEFDMRLNEQAGWTDDGMFDAALDLTANGSAVRSEWTMGTGWDELTLEAWINVDHFIEDNVMPIVSRYEWYTRAAFYFGIYMDGALWGGVYTTGGQQYPHVISDEGLIEEGEWYHVALTWASGDELILWLDGEEVASVDCPGGVIRNSPDRLTVGYHWNNNRYPDDYFFGCIDEVRVSDVVRDIQGDGEPVIAIDPEFIEAEGSSEHVINIANDGDRRLRWRAETEAGWISCDPQNGFVAPGSDRELFVTLDAEGLEPGDHEADLRILSNDPERGEVQVPVTLRILERIIRVPDDFETIGEAIDAAEDGDTVLVDPGEYVENIDFSGKDIVIIGNPDDPGEVIIDGDQNGSVVVFVNRETEDAVLSGFTLINGSGSLVEDDRKGGGIYCIGSSPTLMHLIIRENNAEYGGGIYCFRSNPSITHIIITENEAQGGGGVNCEQSGPVITDTEVSDNYAGWGAGGIYCGEAHPTLMRVVLSGNIGEEFGGGIMLVGNSTMNLTNVTISGNEAGETGGAIYVRINSTATIVNSIIWGNSEPEVALGAGERNNIDISYSDVEGGQDGIELEEGEVNWGEGNIDADPLFADPDDDDFHLTWENYPEEDETKSPCIDAGDPDSPEDPDGTRADMGMYYFHQEPRIPGEPLIYWDFNEGEGRVAHDGSGNGFDGTIVSATWHDEGHNDNCLYFDGRDDYVTLDDNDRLTIDEGFMAIAWVFPQYEDEIWHDIMRHHMQTGETEGWVLQTGGNRVLIAMIKMDNQCFYGPEGVGPLPLNAWSKVALAWDGDVGEIWLNGRLELRWETEGNEINSRSDFCVGRLSRNFDRNNHFEGRIDEAAFYAYYDRNILSAQGAVGPDIVADPEALDFGNVLVGESNDRMLTISNMGNDDLIVSDISVEDGDWFSVDFDDDLIIEPGADSEIAVTFAPDEVDEFEDALLIISDDPDDEEVVIPLSGVGVGGIPDLRHFTEFDETDVNHSLVILELTFLEEPVRTGWEIGVFAPDHILAGAGVWVDDERLGIAAWGDDALTEDVIEGFLQNEPFSFRVWDDDANAEYPAYADFQVGPDHWVGNGNSALRLLAPGREISVPLGEGWNMISINVVPPPEMWEREEGPDIILMTEQLRIDEENHHIVIMKDEAGNFYLPAFEFNNIPYWDLTDGYMVKVDADVAAVWYGEPIPADADVPLEEGWNMAAYFPTYELGATAPGFYVLSPIIDHVFLAKDGDGCFMWPELEFSNMPPWRETQGYMIKMDEDVVLNYPEEPDNEGLVILPLKGDSARQHWADVIPTGENMSVLIKSIQNPKSKIQNFQIAAFNSDGLLVGVGWAGGVARKVAGGDAYATGLAVWGDDPSTEEVDGLLDGEAFDLRTWDSENETEMPIHPKAILAGDELIYRPNGYAVIDGVVTQPLPEDYYLSQNYPNPFNSITKIAYGLPEAGVVSIRVYDIAGRLVTTLVNDRVTAGRHNATWDASSMSSGLYIVRMEADKSAFLRKSVSIK